jgi:error-prone DNA polymerase
VGGHAFEPPSALPAEVEEPGALLPAATAGEQTVLDYAGTASPCATTRWRCCGRPWRGGLGRHARPPRRPQGHASRLPGLVLVRQRPGSAKGVVFFTVEDEWGTANLVVYADLVRRFRAAVVSARLVVAEGRVSGRRPRCRSST